MTPAQRKRFGKLIKKARIDADPTQPQLAERLGVSVGALSQWERGIKQQYSRAEAIALEEALGIEDRSLLIELGYEKGTVTYGPLIYPGPKLTPEEEQRIVSIISLFQQRGTS